MACPITIPRGANTWLLARTNRDAPSQKEVIETAAAYLVRVLGGASPIGSRGAFETVQSPEGDNRYYIGAARPVEISATTQAPTSRLPGTVYARREDCPEPYVTTVAGADPWFVTVEFDWRASAKQIEWPRRRVNLFGWPSEDEPARPYDWLLLEASHTGAAHADDGSLAHDVVVRSTKAFKQAASDLAKGGQSAAMLIGGAVLLVGLVWAANSGRRS